MCTCWCAAPLDDADIILSPVRLADVINANGRSFLGFEPFTGSLDYEPTKDKSKTVKYGSLKRHSRGAVISRSKGKIPHRFFVKAT